VTRRDPLVDGLPRDTKFSCNLRDTAHDINCGLDEIDLATPSTPHRLALYVRSLAAVKRDARLKEPERCGRSE